MPTHPKRLALQVWTVRHAMWADLDGTLRRIADLPIDGIEFAAFPDDRKPEEARTLCADLGKAIVGNHALLGDLRGDALERTMDFNRALGNDTIFLVWMDPDDRDTPEAVERSLETIRAAHETLRDHGFRFGYHNHDFDAKTLSNGRTCWDMVAGTMPDDFLLEYDTGNAVMGNEDPVAKLRQYAGRHPIVHLKEARPEGHHGPDLIGDGAVDWAGVFGTLAAHPTDGGWLVVEHESHPTLSEFEVAEQNVRRAAALLERHSTLA